MLSFEQFSEVNLKRCGKYFHSLEEWSPTDWATALAGECGEACNLIKKMRRGQDIDIKEIGKELADVVAYADLLAQRLGLSLGELVRNKFNEVSDRVGSLVKLDGKVYFEKLENWSSGTNDIVYYNMILNGEEVGRVFVNLKEKTIEQSYPCDISCNLQELLKKTLEEYKCVN